MSRCGTNERVKAAYGKTKDKFYCIQFYYHLEKEKYNFLKIGLSPGSTKSGQHF